MMMRVLPFLAAILCAFPALADRHWLAPQDFVARVAGRAVQVFDKNGDLFGTEYFLPKQRVTWQGNGDSSCYQGAWAVQDAQICFRYEQGLGNCFRYYMEGDKMVSVDFVAGKQTTSAHDIVVANLPPPSCTTN